VEDADRPEEPSPAAPVGSEGRIPHPAFYSSCRALTQVMFRVLCRLEIHGAENVPHTGPFILASNHQSYLDPPLLAMTTRRPLSFVSAAELFRIPVLRGIVRRLNAFPVKRTGEDRTALRHGLSVLRDGRGLVMFPEGKRSPDGRLLQPKLGIALLALRSRAPIIPVGIEGANRVHPVQKLEFDGVLLQAARRQWPVPTRIRLRVGEPLLFDDLYGKRPTDTQDLQHVVRTLMEAISALTGRPFHWDPEEKWWHPYRDHPDFRLTFEGPRADEAEPPL